MALSIIPSSPAASASLALALLLVCYYGQKMWVARAPIRRVRKLGKPMPPWNPIFGHLLAAGKAAGSLPPDSHSCYLLRKLSLDFPDGAFYLDVWPMQGPIIVLTEPGMSNQATSHPTVGSMKPASLQDWFYPITGGPSQSDLNGKPWKYLHDLFSPAFSNTNINAMVPVIADRIITFREILREKVKAGERFLLEPLVLDLITDVIGETLFNMRLDVQRQPHYLAEAMREQLRMKFSQYNPSNFIAFFNPRAMWRRWNNSRILDDGIKAQLQKRFREYKAQKATEEAKPFKAVIDIALEDYLRQPGKTSASTLDSEFLTMITRNMRAFFFVGYDSTASTIIFCYYTLSQHPEVLARMRAELDAVFGPDFESVTGQISESPQLLNSLPYTQAVIKETMRLFPVANGLRLGSSELEVVDEKGNRYPTDGFAVVISHYANQMNPKVWPRVEEFLPERWLVEPGHELYPPPRAWRPFEHGARSCPGQQQVFTEIKAVLACTVREFDIQNCYAELDKGKKLDLSGVAGQRPYMIDAGAAHPTGKYPCRISLSGYVPTTGSAVKSKSG
ncbi:cytochrome P450 monooxygenase-like protein [Thozetella sp. PMI_491]|nr:cytochrome P450 monooxygenase-like protein [Thozetella sp. PMI_491]